MLKRIKSGLFTLLLLLSIFINFSAGNGHCESQILVFIQPSVISVAPGESFTIEVRVSNVRNLYSWFFNLSWDPSILSVVEIEEGPFLSGEGAQKTSFYSGFDNERGLLYANCTIMSSEEGVTGSGTLATILFKVKDIGYTKIELTEVMLYASNGQVIVSSSRSAYFTNIVHDIKVSSIDLTDSEVTVGGLAVINVTIENRGNVGETFYVALWANDTLIGYLTIEDLPPYGSKTVTFEWPISGVNPGSYIISAEADYLTLEKNTDDNVYSGPILNVQRGLPVTAIIYALVIAAVIVLVIFVIRRRKQESKLQN